MVAVTVTFFLQQFENSDNLTSIFSHAGGMTVGLVHLSIGSVCRPTTWVQHVSIVLYCIDFSIQPKSPLCTDQSMIQAHTAASVAVGSLSC